MNLGYDNSLIVKKIKSLRKISKENNKIKNLKIDTITHKRTTRGYMVWQFPMCMGLNSLCIKDYKMFLTQKAITNYKIFIGLLILN